MTTLLKKNDIVSLLTGRTPIKINRLLDFYLKENNIAVTKEQWSVLAVLWKQEGITQQEIADATFRDRAGITRLLDNLQKNGLIERQHDKNNRRINLIYLTPQGREIESQVVEVLHQTIGIITKDIPESELNQLRAVFEKINENINAISND